MNKTIVFGGSGLIGSALKRSISKTTLNKSFVFLSRKDLNLSNLKKKAFLSTKKIFKNNTNIIFLAGIKKQYGDTKENYINNIKMVNNLCSIISGLKEVYIIYISSTEVFDTNTNHKINENSLKKSNTFYGKSKINSEKILQKFSQKNKLKLAILRPAQIYGLGDYYDAYGPTQFINKAILNENIEIWGNGSEFREFIYVNDIVKIIKFFLKKRITEEINVVSGQSYRYIDIISFLKSFFSKITVISKQRTTVKSDILFDNSKLIKTLPKSYNFTKLKSGLKRYINEIKR
jgi:UDP-glucose 4-epimerase